MASPDQRLLVLGDSISAEYGLARGRGWVALLVQRLQAAKSPWSVVNASISGETTSGGRSRLGALLKAHQPGLVIIELGANDALRGLSLEVTRQNLQAMIESCRQSGARVLLLGMQVPPNYGADYTRQLQRLYADLARGGEVRRVPFLLAGVADDPKPQRWFQADRIHPNEEAQPLLLDNVWLELKKML
jgi:acyl-CoA thioesterase-1